LLYFRKQRGAVNATLALLFFLLLIADNQPESAEAQPIELGYVTRRIKLTRELTAYSILGLSSIQAICEYRRSSKVSKLYQNTADMGTK